MHASPPECLHILDAVEIGVVKVVLIHVVQVIHVLVVTHFLDWSVNFLWKQKSDCSKVFETSLESLHFGYSFQHPRTSI